jgi:alpha-L-rhamnosidase
MARNRVRYIQLFFLLIAVVPLFACSTGEKVQTGLWSNTGEEKNELQKWHAQWIWLSKGNSANAMLARRNFVLDAQPDAAEIKITATDRYSLFINGQFVGRGPARCAPHHQSFDTYDVRDILKEGNNNISVKVHFLKTERYSYQHDLRPGLLSQLDMGTGDGSFSIITDKNWKVKADLSWIDDTPVMARFHHFEADRIDFREAESDWNKIQFKDSGWANAYPLLRNEGWPSVQKNELAHPLTPPWTTLVRRDIPYLKEAFLPAQKVTNFDKINLANKEPNGALVTNAVDLFGSSDLQLKEFTDKQGTITLPKTGEAECWLLIYDFGELKNSFAQLDIQAAAGTVVDIMYAPYALDSLFSYNMLETEFRDRIILSGGANQWEAVFFKPTRYLAVAVKNSSGNVQISKIGLNQISYPFEDRGIVQSNGDQWIEDYWEASKKTLRVCTTDGYTDNYRERRQYVQTGYYATLGNYWTFADRPLQRRLLLQAAQEQYANGVMPSYAPLFNKDYMVIIESSFFWIRGLRNYLLYTGDYEFVNEMLPTAFKTIEYLYSFTDSLGLFTNPPYAYWLDHAAQDRRGANLCVNGHFIGALQDFSELLKWLDDPKSKIYAERAAKAKDSIQKYLWDDERKLFADALVQGKLSEMFSEHANAMALAMQIASEEQAEYVIRELLVKDNHNFIKRESGITMVTPAMSYFLHKGIADYGYIEESFEMFRSRFDHMLDPSTNQTLWEEWWRHGTGRNGRFVPKTRSDAQTESAFPPALIVEYVFGIKPLQPGLKEIEIIPQQSGVKEMKGTFPTPEGALTVNWTMNKNRQKVLDIKVPGEMLVRIDLDNFELEIPAADHPGIKQGPKDETILYLTNGSYRLVSKK